MLDASRTGNGSAAPAPGDGRAPRGARAGRVLVRVAAALILALTLFPVRSSGSPALLDCLICGERGLADALLNVALFTPLGAALALDGRRRRTVLSVVGSAAVLSGAVELAQLVIPGRDASLGDLLFNTAGAAVGMVLTRTAPAWAAPGRRAAARLSVAAGAGALLVFLGTGFLLRPDLPRSVYYLQWTPDLEHLETYDGEVLGSALAGAEMRPGRIRDREAFEAALLRGAVLRVDARAGTPPPALAPLVSVFDDGQREVVLLGVDGADLVLRHRTRAARWRLDAAAMRLDGALRGLRPGDALGVRVRSIDPGFCVEVRGESRCDVGFTAGSGWALLLASTGFPAPVRHALPLLWVGLWFLPIGFWSDGPRRAGAAALALALGGLLAAPALFGLLATPATQIAAAAGGLVVGRASGRLLRSGAGPSP